MRRESEVKVSLLGVTGGGILTVVVTAVVATVMVVSEEEVEVVANSYSPCVKPMDTKCGK